MELMFARWEADKLADGVCDVLAISALEKSKRHESRSADGEGVLVILNKVN